MQHSRKTNSSSGFKSAGIALALATAGVIAGLVTYAYFTDSERADNDMTIGTNVVTIVEEFDPPELTKGVNIFKKKVQLKNTGNTKSYVRVFVDFSDSEVKKVSGFKASDNTYYSAVVPDGLDEDVTHPDDRDPGVTVKEIDKAPYTEHLPENWVYISEADDPTGDLGGYYYYTKAISPNETTTALIENVMTYFASQDAVVAYEIPVYAESVQIYDHEGNLITGTDPWKQAWTDFLGRKKLGAQSAQEPEEP